MALTRKQLEQYGIRMSIGKHDWHVTSYLKTVASGSIGREWNARNNARKAMLEAAHTAFVLNRIDGPKINMSSIYSPLSPQMAKMWAASMFRTYKKLGFMEALIDEKDLEARIERIDPFTMHDIKDDGLAKPE